jgi:tRNA-binding EMAP/Myf-like protein
MELSGDLQSLGLIVGRVVAVTEHAGARAPSYLLTVDLGPQGQRGCSVPRGDYEAEELEGRQVVCALRGDEVLVLAAHSHLRGVVLLRPDWDVEDGSIVG